MYFFSARIHLFLLSRFNRPLQRWYQISSSRFTGKTIFLIFSRLDNRGKLEKKNTNIFTQQRFLLIKIFDYCFFSLLLYVTIKWKIILEIWLFHWTFILAVSRRGTVLEISDVFESFTAILWLSSFYVCCPKQSWPFVTRHNIPNGFIFTTCYKKEKTNFLEKKKKNSSNRILPHRRYYCKKFLYLQ